MNEKKYLKAIRKQLKCGASKKEEILRQIRSDIAAAMQSGASFESAINEIGSPTDVVKEFNENMSDSDIKNCKWEKRVKTIAIISVIVLLLAALIYWVYPKTTNIKESERFSEQEVAEQAKQIIQYIDKDDFESLKPLMTAQMQKLMTKDMLDDARNAISDDFGSFLSWGNIYMVEVSQMGQHAVVMEITVSYENTGATYRLSFDEDMLLIGLYIR